MNELLEKLEQLKKSLDCDERILNLKKAQKKVLQEKELLETIKKYKDTNKKEYLEKISQNRSFRDYKKKETECNLLIMEINQKLKEIHNKGGNCS